MKSILIKSTLTLFLFLAGYLLGQANSTQPHLVIEDDGRFTANETSQPNTAPHFEPNSSCDPADRNTDTDNADISRELSDPDTDVRLNALFFVWRNSMDGRYQNDIARLASEDRHPRVKSFAQWIEGKEIRDEIMESPQSDIQIGDYNNPDEQLRGSLIENPAQFQQSGEQPGEEPDLLDAMRQLPEEEQLVYIEELTKLQDDAAVSALNELITDYNPSLQNAAIEGLISLLEMRTGHFDMIAQMLEQNAVYLSDAQLEKLHKLTRPTEDI